MSSHFGGAGVRPSQSQLRSISSGPRSPTPHRSGPQSPHPTSRSPRPNRSRRINALHFLAAFVLLVGLAQLWGMTPSLRRVVFSGCPPHQFNSGGGSSGASAGAVHAGLWESLCAREASSDLAIPVQGVLAGGSDAATGAASASERRSGSAATALYGSNGGQSAATAASSDTSTVAGTAGGDGAATAGSPALAEKALAVLAGAPTATAATATTIATATASAPGSVSGASTAHSSYNPDEWPNVYGGQAEPHKRILKRCTGSLFSLPPRPGARPAQGLVAVWLPTRFDLAFCDASGRSARLVLRPPRSPQQPSNSRESADSGDGSDLGPNATRTVAGPAVEASAAGQVIDLATSWALVADGGSIRIAWYDTSTLLAGGVTSSLPGGQPCPGVPGARCIVVGGSPGVGRQDDLGVASTLNDNAGGGGSTGAGGQGSGAAGGSSSSGGGGASGLSGAFKGLWGWPRGGGSSTVHRTSDIAGGGTADRSLASAEGQTAHRTSAAGPTGGHGASSGNGDNATGASESADSALYGRDGTATAATAAAAAAAAVFPMLVLASAEDRSVVLLLEEGGDILSAAAAALAIVAAPDTFTRRLETAVLAAYEALRTVPHAIGLPPGAPAEDKRLARKLYDIMLVNTGLGWSTPDRTPHARQWLWDSCFHALGMNLVNHTAAWEQLQGLLACQQPDGFLPHMCGGGPPSKITQPPLLAWAVWDNYLFARDTARLEWAVPRIESLLQWLAAHRSHDGGRTYFYVHAFESGMDNSPRFDRGWGLGGLAGWLGSLARDWSGDPRVGSCDICTPHALSVDLTALVAREMALLGRMYRELGEEEAADDWLEQSRDVAAALVAGAWNPRRRVYGDVQQYNTLYDTAFGHATTATSAKRGGGVAAALAVRSWLGSRIPSWAGGSAAGEARSRGAAGGWGGREGSGGFGSGGHGHGHGRSAGAWSQTHTQWHRHQAHLPQYTHAHAHQRQLWQLRQLPRRRRLLLQGGLPGRRALGLGDGLVEGLGEGVGVSDLVTVAGLLPLLAGPLPADHLEGLMEHLQDPGTFATPVPLPSVGVSSQQIPHTADTHPATTTVAAATAVQSPSYSRAYSPSLDMWRGPMWVNINYMVAAGLREQQAQHTATASTSRAARTQHGQNGLLEDSGGVGSRGSSGGGLWRLRRGRHGRGREEDGEEGGCEACGRLAEWIERSTVAEVRKWYGGACPTPGSVPLSSSAAGGCTGTVFEYYDSYGVVPPTALSRKGAGGLGGVRDYHWTAALTLRLMAETAARASAANAAAAAAGGDGADWRGGGGEAGGGSRLPPWVPGAGV